MHNKSVKCHACSWEKISESVNHFDFSLHLQVTNEILCLVKLIRSFVAVIVEFRLKDEGILQCVSAEDKKFLYFYKSCKPMQLSPSVFELQSFKINFRSYNLSINNFIRKFKIFLLFPFLMKPTIVMPIKRGNKRPNGPK